MKIPVAKNLFQAKQQTKAILLLLHLEDCPWCHFVIDEVFEPMIDLNKYTDKFIIRQIETNSDLVLQDFYGSKIDSIAFIKKHGVNFYPTVLLFDTHGQLLEKIIGVPSKDTYWTDLDKILEKHY
jgi:thioredoxin-related protein